LIEPLDAEIAAALGRLGFLPRTWQRISTIRAADTGRSVFRVDLENGRTLKARRLESDAAARRLFELRRNLPSGFAPALHCVDAVVLESWIEGETLAPGRASTAQLIEAAGILARLHSTPSADGRALPEMEATAPERGAADDARRHLTTSGYLGDAENDRVAEALAQSDPGHALAGLVHTDFCGENIVLDAGGRLHVIDNERLGIGALGLDVARSWYRWMLPTEDWRCFLEAYRASMSHDDSLRNFSFWALIATLKSAALLSRLEPRRAQGPIDCIRRLLSGAAGVTKDGSLTAHR